MFFRRVRAVFLILVAVCLSGCDSDDSVIVDTGQTTAFRITIVTTTIEQSEDTTKTTIPESVTTSKTVNQKVHNPFENLELPQNPIKWQKAYVDYLQENFSNESLVKSIYFEDINHDEIPEIFLYNWDYWQFPQSVITYTENTEVVETLLDYGTSNNVGCSLFLDYESGQLLTKNTGHSAGNEGKLNYILYNSTDNGYESSVIIKGWQDGFNGKINDKQVDKDNFDQFIDEHISQLNIELFLREPIKTDNIALIEYLNEELLYNIN